MIRTRRNHRRGHLATLHGRILPATCLAFPPAPAQPAVPDVNAVVGEPCGCRPDPGRDDPGDDIDQRRRGYGVRRSLSALGRRSECRSSTRATRCPMALAGDPHLHRADRRPARDQRRSAVGLYVCIVLRGQSGCGTPWPRSWRACSNRSSTPSGGRTGAGVVTCGAEARKAVGRTVKITSAEQRYRALFLPLAARLNVSDDRRLHT